MDQKEFKKQKAEYSKFIRNYPYLRDDLWLSLEPFCVHLAQCMWLDGLEGNQPEPGAIYDLLLRIAAHYNKQDPELGRNIRKIKIPDQDWDSSLEDFYPDKMATIVGPGDLHLFGREWILGIGMELMGVQPRDTERNVDFWANDLDLTKDYISGLLKSLDKIIVELNKHQVSTQGHSFTEAYIRAQQSGASFEGARHVLRARTAAQEEAIGRIQNAISDGYYIEASVLSECVITNALQEYLVLTQGTRESSLYKILQSLNRPSIDYDDADDALFRRADFWRKKRNNSVHGFVESRMRDLEITQREFLKRAEETAAEGIELCRDILDWYQRKTVNIVPSYDQ